MINELKNGQQVESKDELGNWVQCHIFGSMTTVVGVHNGREVVARKVELPSGRIVLRSGSEIR